MDLSRPNLEQKRLSLRIGTFVSLVCVAILALTGWWQIEARDNELRNAEHDMSELARSLTQHAEDTVEIANTVLIDMVDRLEKYGTGPASLKQLQVFTDLRKESMGRIHGLFAYGADGSWLLSSAKIDIKERNNGDREYFQHHMKSDSRETLIGRPIRSRSTNAWIITLSRRFNHPDGTFAGVVLMTIESDWFARYYAQFDVGENGSIALMRTDGILLSRIPTDVDHIGRDLSDSPLMRDLASRPPADVYHFESALDGIKRISFYRMSEKYPLLLLATKAEDDVLAPWRREVMTRLAAVLALVAIVALLGAYLIRQLLARQRMALALQAKESDFRLLAEESSDMVTRIDLDELMLYVSPSATNIVGWRADQLIGTLAMAGVNAEDRPRIDAVVAGLKSGEIRDGRVLYRSRHREKGEIWLETTMRATRSSGTGEITGFVAISRDMTAHKNLESRLDELANLDGLTGIANRRQFDTRLTLEWARARREGTTLSLLLIDVDHFKMFNDHYGHQAGDICLHAVARALAGVARRPGDLAARYGGEEFALIMPDAEAAGCAQVAENFLAALRELNVVHADNPPSGLVTASVGGAAFRPGQLPATADSGMLLEAADRALYHSKDSGRDRLTMSATVTALTGTHCA